MAALYLDTSAAAKMYVGERGTGWMRTITDPSTANQLMTVCLTAPELIAAFARRARGRLLSPMAAGQILARVRADWTWRYVIVEADEPCVAIAMDLAQRYGLRGYDAVHVAAALLLHRERSARVLAPLIFISADQEQLAAAVAEGLTVDDPNRYP